MRRVFLGFPVLHFPGDGPKTKHGRKRCEEEMSVCVCACASVCAWCCMLMHVKYADLCALRIWYCVCACTRSSQLSILKTSWPQPRTTIESTLEDNKFPAKWSIQTQWLPHRRSGKCQATLNPGRECSPSRGIQRRNLALVYPHQTGLGWIWNSKNISHWSSLVTFVILLLFTSKSFARRGVVLFGTLEPTPTMPSPPWNHNMSITGWATLDQWCFAGPQSFLCSPRCAGSGETAASL